MVIDCGYPHSAPGATGKIIPSGVNATVASFLLRLFVTIHMDIHLFKIRKNCTLMRNSVIQQSMHAISVIE